MDIYINKCFERYYSASPLTLIDVGARFGLQENWKAAQKHLEVIAFEADEEEFKRLQKLGGNTTYLNAALHHKKTTIDFHLTKSGGSSSMFRPRREFLDDFPESERYDIAKTIQMETDTLDNCLDGNSIGDIDFVKIDTEGSELFILEGASETLTNRGILGIEIEVAFAQMHDGRAFFSDIDRFLKSHQFELFDLKPFYWKRNTGKTYGGPKGQLVFADALYLRSFDAMNALLLEENRSAEYKKNKVLKAISISILYGYLDRVVGLFEANTDLFSDSEKDVLYRELKTQIPSSLKVPNFRGRYRLYKLVNKISKMLEPHAHDWASSPTKLGNVGDIE
jgi:FkbM family methyltransferase